MSEEEGKVADLDEVFKRAHERLDEISDDPEAQEEFWRRAHERAEKRACIELNNEYHVIGGAADVIDEILSEDD